MEIKTEADSNDITDKPSTGMFVCFLCIHLSVCDMNTVCNVMYFVLCSQCLLSVVSNCSFLHV